MILGVNWYDISQSETCNSCNSNGTLIKRPSFLYNYIKAYDLSSLYLHIFASQNWFTYVFTHLITWTLNLGKRYSYTWLPKKFLCTVQSRPPTNSWPPSFWPTALSAKNIRPAHVPQTGFPVLTNSRRAGNFKRENERKLEQRRELYTLHTMQ